MRIYILVIVGLFSTMLIAQEIVIGCLNLVARGTTFEKVHVCEDIDPNNIRTNEMIMSVISELEIDLARVEFRGCENSYYSVKTIAEEGQKPKYIITYPLNKLEYNFAPIVHELSHIVQMEEYGGYHNLKKNNDSLRIGLGADFIAGVIYYLYLPETDPNQFHLSTSVYGLYREFSADAHGTPSQRSSAFLTGYNWYKIDKTREGMKVGEAHSYFQNEQYGNVVSF